MAAPRKCPEKLRERAIRMAVDLRRDPATRSGALRRVGEQLGINPKTLRIWVGQAEIDQGHCPGVTTEEARRIAELEREVKELRRARGLSAKRCFWPDTLGSAGGEGHVMTEKTTSMSSMPKEVKKTTSRSEAEQAAVREVVKAARARGEYLTGPDGLLKSTTATVLQTALEEELIEHPGHEQHQAPTPGNGNIRNGTRPRRC